MSIDNDDIGGVVTSANGPEAGVWVIAETTRPAGALHQDRGHRRSRPLRGARSAEGELQRVGARLWAGRRRRSKAAPGKKLNLTAMLAPNEAAAAQYYPAIYWYSMLKIPAASEFGGKGDIPAEHDPERVAQRDEEQRLRRLPSARPALDAHDSRDCRTLGKFATSADAWLRRVQSGQAGASMIGQLVRHSAPPPFRYFGDWTDRIAKGELPHAKPPRPQGVERNIVVTSWDWMDDKHYLHDLIATDRRNPTVNANGPLYGSPEYSTDIMPILDPVKNIATRSGAGARSEHAAEPRAGHAASDKPMQPSPYWGERGDLGHAVNNHNSMFDAKGRVWLAAAVRGAGQPGVLQGGLRSSVGQSCSRWSGRPPARDVRSEDAEIHVRRHLLRHAPSAVRLRRQRHAVDQRRRAGGRLAQHEDVRRDRRRGEVAGLDAAHPRHQRQRQARRVRRAEQPVDPTKDKRIVAGFYAVMPSPVDGSIWGSVPGNPGRGRAGRARVESVRRPRWPRSTTCRCPASACAAATSTARASCGCRWRAATSAASTAQVQGSAERAEGDRRSLPRGLDVLPVSRVRDSKASATTAPKSSYYTWVDQHNTFGLGEDVPMSTGNLNDGLIALKDGKMIVLRVPYPLGFYAKGFDGRIDDPNAGWKGRGLWAANGDRTPWLIEGGKGTKPLAAHFQLRPDPLAK